MHEKIRDRKTGEVIESGTIAERVRRRLMHTLAYAWSEHALLLHAPGMEALGEKLSGARRNLAAEVAALGPVDEGRT